MPRVKHLSMLVVALLPLLSALITSYHYHADLRTRPDCAICKSALDLSSGNTQKPLVLIPERILVTSFVFEIASVIDDFLISPRNSRAPPAGKLA